MIKKNLKTIIAGVCVTTMLVTTPVLAASQTGAKELNDTHNSDTTTVEAEVVGNNNVTYVIQIPEKVDFGQIVQPNSPGTAYATAPITVKCTQMSGLASGQGVAVLVKDSEAVDNNDPFKLKHVDHSDIAVLEYSILNQADENIQNQKWFKNGFLFNVFTAQDQEATDTLRLDRGQLYEKDLSIWGGTYTGTLEFYSKTATIGDINP